MDDFEDLLHIDWGEAHRGFVHADELGSAAVQWAGAATEARAHNILLAPPAKKTTAEMAITAPTLLRRFGCDEGEYRHCHQGR